jgi:hypothetical protein
MGKKKTPIEFTAQELFTYLGYKLKTDSEYLIIYDNDRTQILFNLSDQSYKKIIDGNRSLQINVEENKAIQAQLKELG